MPRTARASVGDVAYHVINRGDGHARVFHTDGDYAALVYLIGQAGEHLPLRVLAYCLMPNRLHLVLWPHADGDPSRLVAMADDGPRPPLPRNWIQRVNQAETTAEMESLRQSVNRGTPHGNQNWMQRTAARSGLEASLRPRGRPREHAKK